MASKMSKLEKVTFLINVHLMSHCVLWNEVSSLIIKQDPETSGKYFCFQKVHFDLENSSCKQMLLEFWKT